MVPFDGPPAMAALVEEARRAGVPSLLVQHGYDDPRMIAAAYLHDVLEDCPEYESRLRQEQPREVVEIVEVLTEQKLDADGKKRHCRAREAAANLRAA
jgi:(p)ppGpp synthase/HD superfamily hydrolase